MDKGPFLERVPFLLIMGTSEAEYWLIFPEGIELVYLLCVSRTGGSYYLFMRKYKYNNYVLADKVE